MDGGGGSVNRVAEHFFVKDVKAFLIMSPEARGIANCVCMIDSMQL